MKQAVPPLPRPITGLDGQAQIYAARCDAADTLPPTDWLDEREMARYAKYRQLQDRARFLTGRWLLRGVMARQLDCAAPEVPLMLAPAGQPIIANGPSVSLSHGGDWVLLAISDTGWQVGIDIEPLSRASDAARLTARFCAPEELAAIGRPPAAEPCLRLWCLKEAALKCSGVGLSEDPRQLVCDPASATILQTPSAPGTQWQSALLTEWPGHIAAIVLRQGTLNQA